MKKIFLTCALFSLGIALSAQTNNNSGQNDRMQQDTTKKMKGTKGKPAKDATMHDNSMHADWQVSKDGTWQGDNNTWYKMQNNTLMTSTDGKTWTASTDGYWMDKNTNRYTYKNNSLVWSTDGGTTWNPVPGNAWQGADGTWYMFDKNGKLSTRKEVKTKGGTNTTNPNRGTNDVDNDRQQNNNNNLNNGGKLNNDGMRNNPRN